MKISEKVEVPVKRIKNCILKKSPGYGSLSKKYLVTLLNIQTFFITASCQLTINFINIVYIQQT